MDNLIGQKIENYKFLSIIGKGGMGIVYLALDEKLQRKVAIKVLNSSHITNKEHVIDRFRTEAQNHAQLLHQNIVTVYGFIEFNNQFAIVMEFIDGESLDKVIERNKQIHIHDVVYIVNQLLEGINFAHKKGYVHRDIKPSNIIVNTDGIVKLMDFGISKSLEEEFPKTKTGARVGTIYYMSPEQIKGREVTPQSDLYAIGCSMYEMITGLPPFFSKNEFDVMDGHLHKQFKLVDNLPSELSSEINRIFSILMQKDPLDRYNSCSELSHEIKKLHQLIQREENDYFSLKSRKKLPSKKKSVLGFSLLIFTTIVLLIFVYIQVKDFMEYKGYSVFEDGKIIGSVADTNYSINMLFELGRGVSFNSGYFGEMLGGIIVGDSGIILTVSAQNEWALIENEDKLNFNKVTNRINKEMIIVSEHSTIYKISNDKSITPLKISTDDYNLFGIDFFDENFGIIVGTDGTIFRTEDGGNNWKSANSNVKEDLFDVHILDENNIICVGMKGNILTSRDTGRSWTKIKSYTDKYLRSIEFIDKNGIIVGGGGTILVTDDGGMSWSLIENNISQGLQKANYLSKKEILAVGNLGTIIISKDGGSTWRSVESPEFNNWKNIVSDDVKEQIILLGNNGKAAELLKGEN